jgi:glycosyltransferase involved in cell wall biosynthesis
LRDSEDKRLALSAEQRIRCLAVLGRRDEPTDAVEEYCRFLGDALAVENCALEIARVRWSEVGTPASLQEFDGRLGEAPVEWFLLQYTALAWSRRGFPGRAVRVLKHLKKSGARCAVVFHDAEAYGGNRWIDRLRRRAQISAMRKLLNLSDAAVFTVPREKISWVPVHPRNITFIPVGANLPAPEKAWAAFRDRNDTRPTVAVFSITGYPRGRREVRVIAEAVTHAAKGVGPIRLVIFGRHSEAGGEDLRAALSAPLAEVRVMGLISAEEIVRVLGASDALLFVRDAISTRRGSAIAGIACGLPVIAQSGPETAPPITEAGVVLVPAGDDTGFGPALLRILSDQNYRASLAERSRDAQSHYFSWGVIAAAYARVLNATSADSKERLE